MKAERIETKKVGEWNGKYPVIKVHKFGILKMEMVVLLDGKSRGVVISSMENSDHPVGYHSTTWDEDVFKYLPETDVIVLSNKDD